MSWYPPNITLRWPDYFHPDADDDGKLVTMAVAAKAAGLVTKRAAVQKLARTFDIENVDQFLESLEEEAAENQKKAMSIAASGALPENEPDGDEAGGPVGASPIVNAPALPEKKTNANGTQPK